MVGELHVREGDRVKAGDIIVRLDQTITRANLAIVTKGLAELAARKARLASERDGLDAIDFPGQLTNRVGELEIAQIMEGERKLFELRRSARLGQKAQLRQQSGQLLPDPAAEDISSTIVNLLLVRSLNHKDEPPRITATLLRTLLFRTMTPPA